MSAYSGCVVTGDRGVGLIVQWLKARESIYDGRLVRTDKGRCSEELQRSVGDVLFNSDELTVQTIEVKTELTKRPNLFLETWSNASEELTRQREGWLYTLRADWLFYLFVDVDELYVLRLPDLQAWAFRGRRSDGSTGRIFDFPERSQAKHAQLNLTKGRCVPIAVLSREVGFRLYRPAHDLAGSVLGIAG